MEEAADGLGMDKKEYWKESYKEAMGLGQAWRDIGSFA